MKLNKAAKQSADCLKELGIISRQLSAASRRLSISGRFHTGGCDKVVGGGQCLERCQISIKLMPDRELHQISTFTRILIRSIRESEPLERNTAGQCRYLIGLQTAGKRSLSFKTVESAKLLMVCGQSVRLAGF
jgi:hypothetical protein